MRFLCDANIPYSAKEIFPEGLEVLHVRDLDLDDAADEVILTAAKRLKAVVVTRDFDFANIVVFPPRHHYGVVVLKLPSRYDATQIKLIISDFFSSIDVKRLRRAVSIVEPGGVWRLRKE